MWLHTAKYRGGTLVAYIVIGAWPPLALDHVHLVIDRLMFAGLTRQVYVACEAIVLNCFELF